MPTQILQRMLCLAWAVVVFAAVMTRVHPVLQRIAERNADAGGESVNAPANTNLV